MKRLICLLILPLLMMSCKTTYTETDDYFYYGTEGEDFKEEFYSELIVQMEEAKLFGERNLMKLLSRNMEDGNVGNAYLGMNGSFGESLTVTVMWPGYENKVHITTHSLDEVDIIIDNSKIAPTIRFKYDLRSISYDTTALERIAQWRIPKLMEHLRSVTITISQEDLGQEPAPKKRGYR